jgi:predicted ATPase
MDSYLYRVRGDVLAKRDSKAAEAPSHEALHIAREQGARTFGLQAAHALGKLYRTVNRVTDAHAVLAPALAGFSTTPEFSEIEQAQTLLAALAEADGVKNAAAARQRRLKLQTSYGQALIHGRGYGASETVNAFERARELAKGSGDPAGEFSTLYGLWAGAYIPLNAAKMQETANAALAVAEALSDPSFACVGHRMQGVTRALALGDFAGALAHFERSAESYDPERDRDSAFRFGQDIGVVAKAYLAISLWVNGQTDRARQLVEEMMALADKIGHIPTLAYAHFHKALYETVRLDPTRAAPHAAASIAMAKEHGIALWQSSGPVIHGWAIGSLDNLEVGLDEMGRALASCRQQKIHAGTIWFVPLLGLLQAQSGQIDDGLATLDTAISELEGNHLWDAEVYRMRAEILLMRDPMNTVPAEEALLTAIKIAQQQKARSFQIRAALSLAKLHQSTGRPADAHAVLAPALEGFAPTPEFPEIAEAQALLDTLAKDDRGQ